MIVNDYIGNHFTDAWFVIATCTISYTKFVKTLVHIDEDVDSWLSLRKSQIFFNLHMVWSLLSY